jgi:flagellar hook-basal body complex protein FliE
MSSLEINRVLSEMRALQARVGPPSAARIDAHGASAGASAAAPVSDFATLMKSSVDKVAGMQNDAKSLSVAYESGDRSVDLTKVMLEVQKAGLAFRAMTEVRNKLIDAYHEVMNMQV